MEQLFGSADALHIFFLLLALGLAFGFEFVNGFHDTANAVATVIYTNSLPPYVAVIWSGMWNLIGVLTSTGAVAYGVVALLPVGLVMNVGSAAGFAMVFSLLISAIIWNLGTWYLGLPASSSHTLFGSIMGVGLMDAIMNSGSVMGGINWIQAKNIGLSLLVSPVVGFIGAGLLLLLVKSVANKPALFSEPPPGKAPPLWIRAILCLTCTGVSFAHGSNDGQKGMGLIMLILIGIIPGAFALNIATPPTAIEKLVADSHAVAAIIEKEPAAADAAGASNILGAYIKSGGTYNSEVLPALAEKNSEIAAMLNGRNSISDIPEAQRGKLRLAFYYTSETIGKLTRSNVIANAAQAATLSDYKSSIDKETKYIPVWVKVAVALSLGFGTMIGWKRIVVTVGEKIGKSHLTYAQGACAEVIAMITIELADRYGMPVSTTHVLSSGVAGTMTANRSGLQMNTLRNLMMAWVLTLPVCIFLGAMSFAGGLFLLAKVFGVR
ncbi:MAG: inorganic phosphate transporter [Chthoniobacteraceae bacterium]|jgi:PiT family inorganic phosphate transporter